MANDHEGTVATLLALGDEEFGRFVLNHLSPDEAAWIWETLTAPELALRTSRVIKAALAEVVEQIRAFRRERGMAPRILVERRSSDSDWHRRAAGWQRLLAARNIELAEVRRRAAVRGQRLVSRSERLSGLQARTRGTSHVVAVALLALDLPVVSRETVRALIPDADPFGIGKIGSRVKKAYSAFEMRGWVERLDDGLVRIVDPDGLLEHLCGSVSAIAEDALTLLRVADAAAEVARSIEGSVLRTPWLEVRRQELISLKRLMEASTATGTPKSRPVRLVPHGEVL